MYRSSRAALGRYTANRAKRWAQPFTKRQLFQAVRAMWPVLATLAPCECCPCPGNDGLLRRNHSHGTFKTFAIYAGAVICFGGLIFAGIRMMSGRFQYAIPGLFGAGVLGWARAGSVLLPARTCEVRR